MMTSCNARLGPWEYMPQDALSVFYFAMPLTRKRLKPATNYRKTVLSDAKAAPKETSGITFWIPITNLQLNRLQLKRRHHYSHSAPHRNS